MVDGRWLRTFGMLLAPAALAGVAGCSSGGHTASTSAAAANSASSGTFNAAELRGALLTQVNGVSAAAPATTGKYSMLAGSPASKQAASAQVTPKACATAALSLFNPTGLAASPAAAVTFRVGGNGVSEVLISSSTAAGSTALAGHFPAACARYKETAAGKTYTYNIKENSVAGIGQQAKVLNVQAVGNAAGNMWSLMYRGAGFVGTVTVVGQSASEAAVQQLGKQAYAFAAKSLA